MPQPQAYVAVVDPTSGIIQEYVTLVDSSGNLVLAANQAPQGRLTLTTAVPVLTATVSASANVLYTPYSGNIVPCWNGTRFVPEVFTELTNVLANSSTGNAGPAAGAAASVYDLFVWKSGTSIFLTRGPAWTNDTTRSAGTAIARVNGVLVNSVAITNGPAIGHGTYVGTIRTDAGAATVSFNFGGAATDGSQFAWFGVWNMYNRVLASAIVRDSEATWNYTTATIRPANNDVGNRVSFVRGLDLDADFAEYFCVATTAAAAGAFGTIGVGLDSVTNFVGSHGDRLTTSAAVAITNTLSTIYHQRSGVGFHFLQALETGDGTNATAFLGNSALVQALKADLWN